jgi:hypothetical protein
MLKDGRSNYASMLNGASNDQRQIQEAPRSPVRIPGNLPIEIVVTMAKRVYLLDDLCLPRVSRWWQELLSSSTA